MACSGYLNKAFNPKARRKVIRELTQGIRESELCFQAVACRGTSGAMIAPSVADKLNKLVMFVRKSLSDSHGRQLVEVYTDNDIDTYIIIDDQICTGDTICSIIDEVKLKFPRSKCLGIFLYARSLWNDSDSDKSNARGIPVYYIKSQAREDDEVYPLPAK